MEEAGAETCLQSIQGSNGERWRSFSGAARHQPIVPRIPQQRREGWVQLQLPGDGSDGVSSSGAN